MLKINEKKGWREIEATEGWVRRLGSDNYSHRSVMLETDTIEDFEEVAEKPAYTKAEYDAKVSELIRRRYSADEEFAIQRKMINASATSELSDERVQSAINEYTAYNAYAEQCKAEAKNPELYKKEE